MIRAHRLGEVRYRFGNSTGPDRFRGLQNYGPVSPLPADQVPVFGFVFPKEYRDLANRLYASLKNGVGYFRGLPATFRVPLSSAQVFQVSDFSIPKNTSPRDEARRYADAIVNWSNRSETVPDLFFVIHPRTSDWLDRTPYYECKALLLKEGILSQHVTTDLIRSSSQFEWSVANIALAAFVKLGGTPWLLDAPQAEKELVLGVGQSSLYDPEHRQMRRYIGFTSCFTGAGAFRFLTLARAAETRDDYLINLESVVRNSLVRACAADALPDRITLHLPKEAGFEERAAIQKGLSDSEQIPSDVRIRIVKVNDSPHVFAVDPDGSDGIPNRGTVVQIGDRDFIVYTEGREERQAWRQRTPTCLRVTPQDRNLAAAETQDLVEQAYRISQVNWRAFNAGSRPITTLYSSLIARVISHMPANLVGELYKEPARTVLENRMWFL